MDGKSHGLSVGLSWLRRWEAKCYEQQPKINRAGVRGSSDPTGGFGGLR